LFDMLAQCIANGEIFAGDLNVHDFESTSGSHANGRGSAESTKNPLTFL
jgi:hypothetical protein